MLVLRRAPLVALLLAGLAVAGCAPTVQQKSLPSLADRTEPIASIAVAPFTPTGRLLRDRAEPGAVPPSRAAALVARHLSEALGARVRVIPAEDVGRVLGIEGAPLTPLRPAEVAKVVAREFGVDAVVLGRVSRFAGRSETLVGGCTWTGSASQEGKGGERDGVGRRLPACTGPPGASVAFSIALHEAPGGSPLWQGRFDETQRTLSENVFNAARYPGGGTRWLSVEELTVWGAGEMAHALPVGP